MKKIFLSVFIILLAFSISLDAQSLRQYGEQMKKEVTKEREKEDAVYNNACKQGTIVAFENYLAEYPVGRYVSDVRNRIKEYDFWSSAKKTNTIDAYNCYLKNSKYRSYEKEANDAIQDLSSIEKWEHIKYLGNIYDFERFIKEYPNSSMADKAKRRVHELKGVQYYKENDLFAAYKEFKETDFYELNEENRTAYKNSFEYYSFSELNKYSTETALRTFLYKYPNGKYTDRVSNYLAIVKMRNTSDVFITEQDLDNAIEYAKDDQTKMEVKTIYDSKLAQKKRLEEERKEREKLNRRLKWQRFKNNFTLGVVNEVDIWEEEYYHYSYYYDYEEPELKCNYNLGLSFLIGNTYSPVQLEIGSFMSFLEYTHIPIFSKVKFNFISGNKSMYINFGVYYDVYNEKNMDPLSVMIGIGVAGYHLDYNMINVKIYDTNKFSLGMGLSFYI